MEQIALRRGAIGAVLAACAGHAVAQAITYQVVARAGETPPGLPAGVAPDPTSLVAWPPAANSAGGVSFRSALTGPGITASNDASLWSGSVGAPVLLAQEGAAAAAVGPGIVFGPVGFGMPSPAMATNGKVAFRTEVAGTGVTAFNNQVIVGGTAGSLTLAARTGLGAPGSSFAWGGLGLPVTNQYGQVAFSGTIDDGVGRNGLWFGVPGSVLSLAIEDQPSVVGGANWAHFTTSSIAPDVLINSAGQVAFRNRIWGPGVGAANDDVLVGGSPGSLHLIARAGDPVADAPAGQWWNVFEAPTLTDDGAVAFRGFVGGAGVSGSNDFGLWRGYVLGVLDCFAREGDGVPGAPLGVVFSSLTGTFGAPRMNDANQCAFGATIAGASVTAATDTGIWAHNDIGALVLVAREGGVAPDSGGAVFTGFGAEGPVLNGLGQVVFRSSLSTPAGAWGLFATDAYGVLHRVTGGPAEPGLSCTPTNVSVTGQGVEDGTATQFAEDGRLILRGTCGGASALFVADVNNVCRPVISDGPDAKTVTVGGTLSLSVVAGGPGTLLYQWRLGGVVITDGAHTLGAVVSGATTPALEVTGVHASWGGVYDCVVTNRCKVVTSLGAVVTVGGCDAVDFNNDGLFPDTLDIDDFLSVFSGGPCSNDAACGDIDFNNDGLFPDTLDIDSLLSVFSGGPCL